MTSAARTVARRSWVTGPSMRIARPREGLAPDDLVGEPQLPSQFPDFIFEQFPQGLDQLEPHARRQPPHIVVGFDRRGRALEAHALDHVRVERTLDQPVSFAGLARKSLELLDEQPADEL